MHDKLPHIGHIVPVGVFKEHQVRLGADIGSAVTQFDSGGDVQLVGKDRALVGLPVAVRVFEDEVLSLGASRADSRDRTASS